MRLWRRPSLDPQQEAAVTGAIRDAEKGNRGEIRVRIEPRCKRPDPVERAAEVFGDLKMDQTRDGTGVLLYVAVKDRQAAVFAGPSIHGASEPGFWQDVVDTVADGFKNGRPEQGLVTALAKIGELLRQHAPGEDTAGNELPDTID